MVCHEKTKAILCLSSQFGYESFNKTELSNVIMFSEEQDHSNPTHRRPEKSRRRELSYLLLVTLPVADTFNLISAKYKSPIICF